jgi:hypothetical protein
MKQLSIKILSEGASEMILHRCSCKMCFLDQKTTCPDSIGESFASQLGGFLLLRKRNINHYKSDMMHQPNNKNNTDRGLKFYLTNGDYNLLKAEYKASGYNSVSAYLRKKITGNGIIIPNTRELRNKLDTIGYQYERIGNNINQIARKVHLYDKEGRFPDDVLTRYNEIMQKYIKVTSELSSAHRAFLRQLSR